MLTLFNKQRISKNGSIVANHSNVVTGLKLLYSKKFKIDRVVNQVDDVPVIDTETIVLPGDIVTAVLPTATMFYLSISVVGKNRETDWTKGLVVAVENTSTDADSNGTITYHIMSEVGESVNLPWVVDTGVESMDNLCKIGMGVLSQDTPEVVYDVVVSVYYK